MFPPHTIQKKELLYDQVYSYTHLIINESLFYQKFLDAKQIEKIQWILQFFEENFDQIYKKINLDLVLEILICFSLAKVDHSKLRRKAYEYLEKFYDDQLHYLRADNKATVAEMEHANILLLMEQGMGKQLYKVTTPLI